MGPGNTTTKRTTTHTWTIDKEIPYHYPGMPLMNGPSTLEWRIKVEVIGSKITLTTTPANMDMTAEIAAQIATVLDEAIGVARNGSAPSPYDEYAPGGSSSLVLVPPNQNHP